MTETINGYYTAWNKGKAYNSGRQIVQMGIKIGSKAPCGIVQNQDGSCELVGDEWDVSYRGVTGLRELGSRLAQRYRIEQVKKVAAQQGWEIVEQPKELLKAGSKEKMKIELRQHTKTAIGLLA
jgi:hypothetical protein